LFADVEHGRFVALAFADHDGPAHGHLVHRAAHGFGGHLVGLVTITLSHGVGRGNGGVFHHAHKFQRQLKLQHVQVLGLGVLLRNVGRHVVLQS